MNETKVTWKILNLKRQIESGYVYSVDFAINGANDYHTHQMTATLGLEKPENLVPYKELTEATILKWIQDKLNAQNAEDNVRNPSSADLENQMKGIIKEKTAPTLGDGVPW
ncbi:MAG: hypothetical protein CL557_12615 [Alphaproteobacteria bacterium]|nr:hypothetical protein [Alphaproteobacteria bacterium]|tara:strand:- start:236 stop:568 length:333 start_codon:yes stop_codon:yes gene_type:complete